MKRVKYFTMLLVALFCSAAINAQGIKIHKNDGTILNILYTDIDSIVAYNNKYESVDLGLSVKWATCNVGAESPEEYGDYFAWGEIFPKSEYTIENSLTYDKTIDKNISGDPAYDAATANWGGCWRMPTDEEMQELINNCKWEWITVNEVYGYKVTSKKNGNSIFLPAAGACEDALLYFNAERGYYWSSSPYGNGTGGVSDYLRFYSTHGPSVYWLKRFCGCSVRPVKELCY